MTCETNRNGLELMKWKFHLKIREKNGKEDNQIDNGRKNQCLNREREKPDNELSVKLSGTHTVNMTPNLTFEHKALRENPSVSQPLECA